MPSRSTHLDETTDTLIAKTAKLEDRNPSQIMAAAVRWYLHLTPGARDAMRRIEATGGAAVEEASWALSRALLEREYETLVRQGAGSLKTDLTAEATEDDIMAEAVRMTRRPARAG
ncbi:hypothetical protein [Caulobacter sp.]|uniref:hypothetical protein n=1 Tax=Caulobacter sp. TaxID=78 RepID=UPI001B1906BA|nr:hypothetical protein [Caulobacter sp.]MBO9546721.1 hypothetical protein [Caulobacter sp.]